MKRIICLSAIGRNGEPGRVRRSARRIASAAAPLLAAAALALSCASGERPAPGSVLTWPKGIDEEGYLALLSQELPQANSGVQGAYPPSSPVAIHGKLRVVGTGLQDEGGNP